MRKNSKHETFIGVSYEYNCFAFVDNNECTDSAANGCFNNAYCTNTLGSYKCSCPSDYILKGDGKTCECKLSFNILSVFYNFLSVIFIKYTLITILNNCYEI